MTDPQMASWLWPGRIPLGGVTMIVGTPGTGRSTLCLSIASIVSSGLRWPDTGERCDPANVLIAQADDSPRHIRRQVDRMGGDPNRICQIVSVQRSETEVTPFRITDADILDDEIDRLGSARLIVVDPISAFAHGFNGHVEHQIRRLLDPLLSLVARRQVALVFTAHFRKGPQNDVLYRAIGSPAFTPVCRMVWNLAQDPRGGDGGRRLELIKAAADGAAKGAVPFTLRGGKVHWRTPAKGSPA